MIGQPAGKPFFVRLDQEHQQLAPLCEKAVQLLVLFVHHVDGLVDIRVLQFTSIPTLELFVKRVQRLMHACVIVSINERLFPLPFR